MKPPLTNKRGMIDLYIVQAQEPNALADSSNKDMRVLVTFDKDKGSERRARAVVEAEVNKTASSAIFAGTTNVNSEEHRSLEKQVDRVVNKHTKRSKRSEEDPLFWI